MIDKRPSWDSIWMGTARLLSRRSHDERKKVGCVVVSEDNAVVLANGYNGAPRGFPNRPASNEPGKSELLHAELNAVLKLPYHYPVGKVMYVTLSPCKECSRMIVQCGIERVVYDEEYRDSSGLEILRRAGITVIKFSELEPDDVLEEYHPREAVAKLLDQLVLEKRKTRPADRSRKFTATRLLPAFMFVLAAIDFVFLYLLR